VVDVGRVPSQCHPRGHAQRAHRREAAVRRRGDPPSRRRRAETADAAERLCLPEIDERALKGLKFNEALPEGLAIATLAARLADLDGAAHVLAEPTRFVSTIE